jgi:hypothetical protein
MVVDVPAAEPLTWTTTHRLSLSSDCIQAIERLSVSTIDRLRGLQSSS